MTQSGTPQRVPRVPPMMEDFIEKSLETASNHRIATGWDALVGILC